ncbi:MAG: alpha/beta hydrolase [Clostridia bacterium]|nr:alpha/beta hydrolase [Clostridia bacterium]
MAYREITFPSSTGLGDIFVREWLIDEPKAIIQMVHGMAEHGERYAEMAEYFNTQGFSFVIDDHMGHGRSIPEGKEENQGYFGEEDGDVHLVEDEATLTDMLKDEFPEVPIILFGHSMGSFIARRYTAFFADKLAGAVFCGTAGSNPALKIGYALAKRERKKKGSQYKSTFINNLAFGSYNKKTEKRTDFDWLTKDEEIVDKYIADPLCGFLFTVAGYMDLFKLLMFVNDEEWYQKVPNDLPILVCAGHDDPVGAYGKGPKEVYAKLRAGGHSKTDMNLYKTDRHEIHNETDRQQVLEDLVKFFNKAIQ